MTYFLQQSLNALQLGSIYALIALGYTMVYGVLTMINFAHGDLFMLGAFFALIGASVLHLPFALVLCVAMALTALLGVTIERLAYKPLRQAPRVSVIITALGVGIFLENLTLVLCHGKTDRHFPSLLPDVQWTVGGVTVTLLQVIIIFLSLALMVALDWMVRRTRVGMAMRAIAWDSAAVPLMGVPLDLVISITFALGAGLGGAAGLMYGLAYPTIDPYMGITVGWKAFIAAVVGGIGNIRGAVIGGLLLGALEIFVPAYLPSTWRDFIAFSLLLVLLVFRPHGILGQAKVQKV